MDSATKALVSFIIVILVICFAFWVSPETIDGMQAHTDTQTGCQYLSKGSSLTPRLDREGKHLGCK